MSKKSYLNILSVFIALTIFFLILASSDLTSQNLTLHDFEILYYSNLNGNIENCNCGEPPLGGLNYISTVVDSKRKKDTPVLLIDGGDFCNPYPFPEIDEAILDIYKIIRPDILILGDQEFIEGSKYTNLLINTFQKDILASSYRLNLDKTSDIYDSRLKNGIHNQVLSFVDQHVFKGMPGANIPIVDEELFKLNYGKLEKDAFKILVYHGALNRANIFLKDYPLFDLVLLSHDQRDGSILQESPLIIGGGADGEYLVNILVRKTEHTYDFEVSKLSISKAIPSNSNVDKIISRYRQQVKQK